MSRVYSNGPSRDFVVNPFKSLAQNSHELWVAAPYVTQTDDLIVAAKNGKHVSLLTGLNTSTSPFALKAVFEQPNCRIRYFTRRFHAKFYIFGDDALIGSSNLTDGGLRSNREATIHVDSSSELDELRGLFDELWESAAVLTAEKLAEFTRKHGQIAASRADLDGLIEAAVGRAEPTNIDIGSRRKSAEGVFLETLRRQVQEYRASFNEVKASLTANGFRRMDLQDLGTAMETNRFLNWLRLTHIDGDETWEEAPQRSVQERRAIIERYGFEWTATEKTRIPPEYIAWLQRVRYVFGTRESINDASKDELSEAFLSIHAFHEQLRFVAGGKKQMPVVFWAANSGDVNRVKRTIVHLLHGPGEFVPRLYQVVADPTYKLGHFGRFCALELYGTIKPDDYPPINGRMAKALRFLGFNVRGK